MNQLQLANYMNGRIAAMDEDLQQNDVWVQDEEGNLYTVKGTEADNESLTLLIVLKVSADPEPQGSE